MRRIPLPLRVLFFAVLCMLLHSSAAAQVSASFDKRLADSLGADQYGMKKFILVMLKTGPVKAEKAVSDSLFAGHMANIGVMAKAGQLVVAGPMGKNDRQYRGIFILNVATQEEAKKLLDNDPAVKAGLLDAEMFNWYGSAALPMYLPYHDKVAAKNN